MEDFIKLVDIDGNKIRVYNIYQACNIVRQPDKNYTLAAYVLVSYTYKIISRPGFKEKHKDEYDFLKYCCQIIRNTKDKKAVLLYMNKLSYFCQLNSKPDTYIELYKCKGNCNEIYKKTCDGEFQLALGLAPNTRTCPYYIKEDL